jgi:hypothetical protein
LAAPGTYLIEIEYGGKKYGQNFQLLRDPRLEKEQITDEVLKQQVALCLQIRDIEWMAKDLSARIKKFLAEGDKLNPSYLQLKQLDGLLNTDKSLAYGQPMLLDQIAYLREMLQVADQLPGKDAYDRFKDLKSELDNHYREWLKISKATGIPD